jgi:hypothetical protein
MSRDQLENQRGEREQGEAVSSLLLPFLGVELLIKFINQQWHTF